MTARSCVCTPFYDKGLPRVLLVALASYLAGGVALLVAVMRLRQRTVDTQRRLPGNLKG